MQQIITQGYSTGSGQAIITQGYTVGAAVVPINGPRGAWQASTRKLGTLGGDGRKIGHWEDV